MEFEKIFTTNLPSKAALSLDKGDNLLEIVYPNLRNDVKIAFKKDLLKLLRFFQDLQSECKRLKDLVQQLEQENQNIKATLEEKNKTSTLTNLDPDSPTLNNQHQDMFDQLDSTSNNRENLIRDRSASRSDYSSDSSRKASKKESLHEAVWIFIHF